MQKGMLRARLGGFSEFPTTGQGQQVQLSACLPQLGAERIRRGEKMRRQQVGTGCSFQKAFRPVGMWGRPAPEAGVREEVPSSQERT